MPKPPGESCSNCMAFVSQTEGENPIGECRWNAPDAGLGWPNVAEDEWCANWMPAAESEADAS